MSFSPDQARDFHGRWTSGAATPEEATARAAITAGKYQPLSGMPVEPIKLNDGTYYAPGPNAKIQKIAEDYMAKSGIPYNPPTNFVHADPDLGTRIAKAFDDMKHDPDDPTVKASYDALKRETLAQYQALTDAGIKVDWIKPGQRDPYLDENNNTADLRKVHQDVDENNHWWGYPTEAGFGEHDKFDQSHNPMLEPAPVLVGGRPVTYNDVFRFVHDMMGHVKNGNGFRADGEENAWRAHRAMFSPLAQPAMTTETRGQASWVNYGPYGAQNRAANSFATHYAPQKVGLMPDWTWHEGA